MRAPERQRLHLALEALDAHRVLAARHVLVARVVHAAGALPRRRARGRALLGRRRLARSGRRRRRLRRLALPRPTRLRSGGASASASGVRREVSARRHHGSRASDEHKLRAAHADALGVFKLADASDTSATRKFRNGKGGGVVRQIEVVGPFRGGTARALESRSRDATASAKHPPRSDGARPPARQSCRHHGGAATRPAPVTYPVDARSVRPLGRSRVVAAAGPEPVGPSK